MDVDERAKADAKIRGVFRFVSIAVVGIALFVTLVTVRPAMPDRIHLLCGPEESAYHDLGARLAAELAKRGLDAEVVVTNGGIDNLRRLQSAGSETIALAPSTMARAGVDDIDLSRMVALGNIEIDPLWLFYRNTLDVRGVHDLAGLVVATEGPGAVSDTIAANLLEDYGVEDDVELRSLTSESVVDAILGGEVDALFVTGTSRTPLIKGLLQSESLSFLSFARAETYALLIPGTFILTVPEGVFDLERGVPAEDATLLASATTLVATEDLHRAVAPVLLDVASVVHDRHTVFVSDIDFPNGKNLVLPLDRAAKRYFEQGETGLSGFLHYGTARWINHLGVVVLPVLVVVAMALKVVPVALRVWGQFRLTGFFRRLAVIEKGIAAGRERPGLLEELDKIDQDSASIFVPISVVHDYVDLRQFVHDMRDRIEGASNG